MNAKVYVPHAKQRENGSLPLKCAHAKHREKTKFVTLWSQRKRLLKHNFTSVLAALVTHPD